MAEVESQGFEVDSRFLNSLQVADPACSKIQFTELDEWLDELRSSLEDEPRDLIVRVTRFKNRHDDSPVCDVFAIAGFHSTDGCLNELACQSESADELGAFKLLDGTKEAIEQMGRIRQGVQQIAEDLEADIQIRGGRFEN
jgi:hypothetical protein